MFIAKNTGHLKSGIIVSAIALLSGLSGVGCENAGGVSGGSTGIIQPGTYETDSTVDNEGYTDIDYLKFNQDGTGTETIRTFQNDEFTGYGWYTLKDSTRIPANGVPLTWKTEGGVLSIAVSAAKLEFEAKIVSLTNSSMELLGMKAAKDGVNLPISGKTEKYHRVD